MSCDKRACRQDVLVEERTFTGSFSRMYRNHRLRLALGGKATGGGCEKVSWGTWSVGSREKKRKLKQRKGKLGCLPRYLLVGKLYKLVGMYYSSCVFDEIAL